MTLTLTIETSCDETAISIVDFKSEHSFTVLSDLVLSQVDIHKEFGGVYPAIAKREHLNNLFPLFIKSLKKAKLLKKRKTKKELDKKTEFKIKKILERDWENFILLVDFYKNYEMPKIKLSIATYGPGLEIALWTGFNFTKSLSLLFDSEFIGANHMEGHLYSTLIEKTSEKNKYKIKKINYPSLGLLISGGHTELVLIKDKLKYNIIGKTLDDAVGEAYDKSARLIGIEYPGGPEISKNAENFEKKHKDVDLNKNKKELVKLPRPMIHKPNFDFSFSGLKTAVLYIVKAEEKIRKKISQNFKELLSAEIEDSISEVLYKKTKKAIEKYKTKNLLVGGGVSANNRIRKELKKLEKEEKIRVYFPDKKYTGDNALMISIAGYLNWKNKKTKKRYSKVDGNLKLK